MELAMLIGAAVKDLLDAILHYSAGDDEKGKIALLAGQSKVMAALARSELK